MKVIAIILAAGLLAGCDLYEACTPESAKKAGDYFGRCLEGDGFRRPDYDACANRARIQQICAPQSKSRQ